MIKFVLPIFFSVACAFAQVFKEFNTYAICTAIDNIRYCATMNTESKISITDKRVTVIDMKENVYDYVVDTTTINKVKTEGIISQAAKVREYFNGNEMLEFYSFANNSGYSLVDTKSQCYIKKYYFGSIEQLKKEYYYIDTDVNDIEGFISRCLMDQLKKSDKTP